MNPPRTSLNRESWSRNIHTEPHPARNLDASPNIHRQSLTPTTLSSTPLSSRPSTPTSGALSNQHHAYNQPNRGALERSENQSKEEVNGIYSRNQRTKAERLYDEEDSEEEEEEEEEESEYGSDCQEGPLPKNFVHRQLVKSFPEGVNVYRKVKKVVDKF